jgi:hypothetical protein
MEDGVAEKRLTVRVRVVKLLGENLTTGGEKGLKAWGKFRRAEPEPEPGREFERTIPLEN